MEDSELTRKAIEELMRDMDEYKEKESVLTERKKNPLGKPNKLFLGRTINSMLKHNKRQSDRNLQRCERKLKELDEKKRKHRFIKRQRAKSETFQESISIHNSCDEETFTNRTNKTLKKRKKKRRKKKRTYSSSSRSSSSTETSSSSSNTALQSETSNRKKTKHKKTVALEKEKEVYGQEFYNDYVNDNIMSYYLDPNMAYATLAYGQMNHMMQQQQMFQQQEIVKNELEESVEIPSELSISCHSSPESSLNISLNSSSAEEDENGILTFKLSSDDENDSRISEKGNKTSTSLNKEKMSILSIEGIDNDSVHSHISLESKDSQKSNLKEFNEIYLLSSSCSDSDELQIVETTAETTSNL